MDNLNKQLDELAKLIGCIDTLESCRIDKDRLLDVHILYSQDIVLAKAKKIIESISEAIDKQAEHTANILINSSKSRAERRVANTLIYSNKGKTEREAPKTIEPTIEVAEKEEVRTVEVKSPQQHDDLPETKSEPVIEEPVKEQNPSITPTQTELRNTEIKDGSHELYENKTVSTTYTQNKDPQPIAPKTEVRYPTSHNSSIDLKKELGIGDRFRFQRELFGGNGEKLSTALTTLNDMATMDDAINYITTALRLDLENPISKDFVDFVQKRFR